MRLFVMRHGETGWNKINRTQGEFKSRLTKEGKEQTKLVAEKLKNEKIDLIISSPLFRTMQTANIVNKELNTKIVKDKMVAEIGQGIYAGRFKSSYTEEELKRKKLRLKEDGCESLQETFERVGDFINKIKNNFPDKTILVVTHSIIGTLLDIYIKHGKFNNDIYNQSSAFPNSEVRLYNI